LVHILIITKFFMEKMTIIFNCYFNLENVKTTNKVLCQTWENLLFLSSFIIGSFKWVWIKYMPLLWDNDKETKKKKGIVRTQNITIKKNIYLWWNWFLDINKTKFLRNTWLNCIIFLLNPDKIVEKYII
jgi:hypothetical protein